MTRLFLTGATGYIGGQVLHAIRAALPAIEITALVRKENDVKIINEKLPGVNVALGDLENDSLIEGEAEKADIVIHAANSKHIQSVQSIARGIEKSKKNVHYLQISGASVLSFPEITSKTFGEPSDKIFSDVSDLTDIKSLISTYASFRVVDNFILNLHKSNPNVKTALIFPPIIYGVSDGPVNQRSIQIPELARIGIEGGQVVQVGRGLSRWGYVHVEDLGDVFVKLVQKALGGGDEKELWNENGVYFAENGLLSFGEISQRVAKAEVEKGYIQNGEVKQVSAAEIDALTPHGSVVLGTNALVKAQRAREYLGWTPKRESLEENIPVTVEIEKERWNKL